MVHRLEKLKPNEVDALLEVPVLITIMVADADAEITEEETEWAQKLTKFRSVSGDINVQDYYRHVEKSFQPTLIRQIKHYESITMNAQEVLEKVAEDLAKINPVLEKLYKIDNEMAVSLYSSFLSFAEHVARVSGGLFYFGSITPKEQELIGLHMIENPSAQKNG